MRTARNRPLKGLRVLVIEDEYFIADDIRDALTKAGARVVGSVATLEAAWAALSRGNFDCAVVDLNLHDESALPVAEALLDERKPLLIATGYDGGVLTDRLKDVARVEKPFEPAQLIRVLEQSIGEPG